ncbi:MAG: circadian clock protein KaiC [Methylobacter sp.]|uniref:circadian clock protein KaiC n=1 Tax=Methylobacter sp. TaxID=2051955 RepID=UPI00273127FA|nr:circadian clock protein KaiC [Methylobacter sp.]MDP1664385.1 circadian clock protein KaiC [Methylobacter sp.]
MNEGLQIEKLPIGLAGFDLVSNGGLPKGRTTLIAGTSGSAKTVFAAQFLVEGIVKAGECGVFVTFEEAAEDIRRNMMSLGWDISEFESNGQWLFVDASPHPEIMTEVIGDFDFGALLARIEYAVKKVNAKRISLDSLGAVFSHFTNASVVRHELFRIATAIKHLGVTALMTAERTSEYGDIARYNVEEFVADNVIILRNVLDDAKRRRTLEILKFRGTSHQKGEFPFCVIPGEGVVVIPLSSIQLKQRSSGIRITSGNTELDNMCGSGYFRDSIVLVSGATGTGKTMMTAQFMAGGARNDERCLIFAFEESREQLIRNATGWGVDFEQMEQDGKFKIVCEYPEVGSLEDHFISMKAEIDAFKPNRLAVDSLSALERVSTVKSFREFLIGLTSYIKHQEIAGMFTATTPTLTGGTSVTEEHISTLTDSIVLLRYVEMRGEMRRGITVLKMRGSNHDKDIREYQIVDGKGMVIGKPFRHIGGILVGNPTYVAPDEIDRITGLFKDE